MQSAKIAITAAVREDLLDSSTNRLRPTAAPFRDAMQQIKLHPTPEDLVTHLARHALCIVQESAKQSSVLTTPFSVQNAVHPETTPEIRNELPLCTRTQMVVTEQQKCLQAFIEKEMPQTVADALMKRGWGIVRIYVKLLMSTIIFAYTIVVPASFGSNETMLTTMQILWVTIMTVPLILLIIEIVSYEPNGRTLPAEVEILSVALFQFISGMIEYVLGGHESLTHQTILCGHALLVLGLLVKSDALQPRAIPMIGAEMTLMATREVLIVVANWAKAVALYSTEQGLVKQQAWECICRSGYFMAVAVCIGSFVHFLATRKFLGTDKNIAFMQLALRVRGIQLKPARRVLERLREKKQEDVVGGWTSTKPKGAGNVKNEVSAEVSPSAPPSAPPYEGGTTGDSFGTRYREEPTLAVPLDEVYKEGDMKNERCCPKEYNAGTPK